MTAAEFVQRVQPDRGGLPNVAYTPTEAYYLQAALPEDLQHKEQVEQLLACFAAADTVLQTSVQLPLMQQPQQPQQPPQQAPQSPQERQQWQLSQEPRLWVSPAGAVSPLHYDLSHSFLVQVLGRKRMLFFSPDQMYRLYCYPDTHLLRRRSRVNVSAPDFAKFPLFSGVGALEAVLVPGDVVAFPSGWSHYTESMGEGVVGGAAAGCCMSMTFRCKVA